MKVISLSPTKEAPRVYLSKEENKFEFEGRSRPENVEFFYRHIYDWFEEYRKSPNPVTLVDMNFEYFNTSSAKAILGLLKLMEEMREEGINIKVIWHYHEEDEDMQDAGEDYASMVKVPFEYKVYT